MSDFIKATFLVFFGILSAVALSFCGALIVGFFFMLAWNYVAVTMFGAPTFDFWHAVVAMFLLSLVGSSSKGSSIKTST